MADVIEAASSGNIELVKEIFEANPSCVLETDSRYDCLFLALALPQPMHFGSFFLISVISGFTALIGSSLFGHFDVTRFLVENGANVDARTNDDNTALIFSSQEGHLDVTRFLVESKADLHKKEDRYYTPYNMIFQIARTAAFRFIYSNFCYQW